jgi:NAD-dependent dihydropyrimidine dehydrogenase PreA subunit
MTRWCPLYGLDTQEESWKVFDEEQCVENLKCYKECKKRKAEEEK